ncbi:chromatin-remodeling complex ATPase chain Iswi-like [Bradysia coprophila]|uniref:chromatin-remodeling complex ATPase chain Iswi-like n=1 Tax=Bradysia coprophila TaxID=38358 RepID=UPI00187DBBD5|nr:chromatin-remodeling complex ATPase chain Iswi-like [Bradysia coprophila]
MRDHNENIQFDESTKFTPKNAIANRNEFGVNLVAGPISLNPLKRKIDANTIAEVTTHKRGRFDNLINTMKCISKLLESSLIPTKNGSSSTFIESPTYMEDGQLRPYQITGLNWLIALHENNLGGMLADETGLGKTIQVIALIGYLQLVRKVDGRYLIIVPLATVTNWESEFLQWCPSLKVVSIYGNESVRQQVVNKILNVRPFDWDVCITTYETCKLKFSRKFFATFRWDYVILDEGTRIKNEKTVLARIIRRLTAKHRLILTGIPLNNNLHELWALLSFLMPNEFSSSIEFCVWFDDDACLDQEETVLNNLYTVLQPLMLRRLKSEVEKIPPYEDINVLVNITNFQRECYREILIENMDIIDGTNVIKRGRLNSLFMQLRKCTNHPHLFYGPPFRPRRIVEDSGKMIVLDMILAQLKRRKSRVLIFSQFTGIMDIIENYLSLHPEYGYCRIDGSVNIDERTSRIAEFQDPDSKKFIFLLCTRSGGLGINLTAADSVIIYDSDWNPQMDLQAISRVHRIGQTKAVRVFRLIAKNTVDEKMIQRADMKLRLSNIVIESHVKSRSVTPERFLLSTVRFGTDTILSNDSHYDGVEWDALVQKNSQILVDEIFKNQV